MWKYILAGFLVLMGAIEILLAFNRPVRDEILKNSPIQLTRNAPLMFLLAGISALAIALVLLFYNRFL